MSKQEIYDFLKEIDLCDTCILRYLSTRCDEFENIEQAFANVNNNFCLYCLFSEHVN